MLSGDAEETQAVKDGHLEAAYLAEFGVNVERVTVAAQAVQRRLVLACLLLDDSIGSALWRLVHGSGRATIATLLGSTEGARATNEYCCFVVEDVLARVCILGGGTGHNDAGCALVNNFNELGVGNKLGFCGNRELSDLKELLAMEKHHRGEVGHTVAERERCYGIEWRNDTEGGKNLEVVVTFEYKGEISSLGTNSEVYNKLAMHSVV